MPSYDHVCLNEECKHEWEDFYSIKDPVPTYCPKCGQETVKRLISCTSKGVVELYGQDLADKVKEDTEKLKKEIYSSSKAYANILGEEKYHALQTKLDRRKRK